MSYYFLVTYMEKFVEPAKLRIETQFGNIDVSYNPFKNSSEMYVNFDGTAGKHLDSEVVGFLEQVVLVIPLEPSLPAEKIEETFLKVSEIVGSCLSVNTTKGHTIQENIIRSLQESGTEFNRQVFQTEVSELAEEG